MAKNKEIKLLCREDPDDVVCPFCGRTVFHPTEEWYDLDPCPHFVFWYVGELYPGYEYWSEDHEKRFHVLEKELEKKDTDPGEMSWEEQIPAMGYEPGNFVIVEYEYSGIACGPVTSYTYYGFDRKAGDSIDKTEE